MRDASLSFSTSFDKHNMSMFYDNYEMALQKTHLTPDQIFNLDKANTKACAITQCDCANWFKTVSPIFISRKSPADPLFILLCSVNQEFYAFIHITFIGMMIIMRPSRYQWTTTLFHLFSLCNFMKLWIMEHHLEQMVMPIVQKPDRWPLICLLKCCNTNTKKKSHITWQNIVLIWQTWKPLYFRCKQWLLRQWNCSCHILSPLQSSNAAPRCYCEWKFSSTKWLVPWRFWWTRTIHDIPVMVMQFSCS